MWVHVVVFVVIVGALAGWKKGWIPSDGIGGKKGIQLFAAVAIAGNIIGMLLTAGSGNGQVYSQGYRLEKEDTGSYEKEFLVSVDGKEAESVYVQIPEKEQEEVIEQKESRPLTEQEKIQRSIQEEISRYNEEKNDPDYYYLPDELSGQQLLWQKPDDHSGVFLAGIFFLTALVMLVIKGREEQVKLQKSYEELLLEYPGLIMKFTLLVQAGMTVRKAFQKISLDYAKKRKRQPKFAYEAIRTVCYEMDSGISEAEAYRRFGERCGQVKYKTLATLLIQNLQKGSRQMADVLEREAAEAWEERKRKARVLGEAAATKLLLPMIMMLMVVMAIVMIPAFLSFYGGM